MEERMNQLSNGARSLIDRVGVSDGPSLEDRERVRKSLFGALAAGATVAGSTGAAMGAQAGSGLASAAAAEVAGGTVFTALTGKGAAAIALWFVAGGVAGAAIATPVALYGDQPSEPAAVALPHKRAAEAKPAGEHRTASGATSKPSQSELADVPRDATQAVRGNARAGSKGPPVEPARASFSVSHGTDSARDKAAAPQIASEVALLKRAQRELASANAAESLALLDDHARRYPEGALKAERLGARVFALCQLGQVEQARATAREFLSIARSSPLVPRVLASCAGSGATEPGASNPASRVKR
jgi:hypothetical protein